MLFSHWGGISLLQEARAYAERLTRTANPDGVWPLDRFEPQTVMVDFIRHLTQWCTGQILNDYYLGRDENDGDNSNHGHYILNLPYK